MIALLLAQLVWIDGEVVTRAGDHPDRTIQLTCGVGDLVAGGRPDRMGLVERRGGWSRTFEGDTINAIAVRGPLVAAAGADGIIRLLAADDGRTLRTLQGHAGPVLAVAFSPDGATLATGGADRSIRLWDAAAGTLRAAIHNHAEPVNALAFSPDGRRLASASSDRSVRIWDPAIGRLVRIVRGRESAVLSVAYTDDGRRLAAGYEDGGVSIIDAERGTVERDLKPFGAPVYALAAGRDVIAGAWTGETVRIDPAAR